MDRREPSLRTRAMRLLARREHSREELKRKLASRLEEGDDLEALLADLAAHGWLSDTRYAEQAIRSKARRYGRIRVAHDLRAQGVDDETIAAGFRAAGIDGEAHIEQVWARRFHEAPGNERERARQVRFLQGRGFALDEILKLIKSIEAKP